MCVTIFSIGGKFRPVSIFTQLHALTLVARSYALLLHQHCFQDPAHLSMAFSIDRMLGMGLGTVLKVKIWLVHVLQLDYNPMTPWTELWRGMYVWLYTCVQFIIYPSSRASDQLQARKRPGNERVLWPHPGCFCRLGKSSPRNTCLWVEVWVHWRGNGGEGWGGDK